MELMERYNRLKSLVVERKVPFAKLMNFIENETSYLSCPASTRFHLCKEQGLLEHSVNVAETLLKIKKELAEEKVHNFLNDMKSIGITYEEAVIYLQEKGENK